MNFIKLGLRNIVGITFPGAILVVIMLYVFVSICYLQSIPMDFINTLTSQQFILSVILFIISYIFGSVLRLESADKLDKKSSRFLKKKYLKDPPDGFTNEKDFEKIKDELLKGNFNIDIPVAFDKWIWIIEKFPYPIWESRKIRIYHPKEVSNFYKSYEECMGIGTKVQTTGRGGKEFFNYCKMVIANSSKECGDSLKEEIFFAEAMTRFFSGTYMAINISLYITAVLAIVLSLFITLSFFGTVQTIKKYNIYNLAFCISIIILFGIIKLCIVKKFRTLRLKEVDTVYDAFYLVHRHADYCPKCSEDFSSNDSEFIERAKLLKEAFNKSQKESNGYDPIKLDTLLNLMKEKSGIHNFLSSIYFAGYEGDHPYFLQNEKIAVGIAVLPEDLDKSYLSKYHEHQQEIIIGLNGTIVLDIKDGESILKKNIAEGDIFVIEKKQCHRISSLQNKNAAFLFIKTNPAIEPRSNKCEFPKE
ncbi:MAG: hypothetical protein C4539_20400 [Ignavibacteriales bacterium]|nr:MAG: hypothetical protein C4539_20400 [Ignavibacteriales bacterium]